MVENDYSEVAVLPTIEDGKSLSTTPYIFQIDTYNKSVFCHNTIQHQIFYFTAGLIFLA